MSQVTVTTTTPPVMVVWSEAMFITLMVTLAPTSWPDNMQSAWCGSTTTVNSEGHKEGFCWPHHCAAATATSVSDAFSVICQLCHGLSTGRFLFWSWASSDFLCYVLVSVVTFAFCFQVFMWLPFSPMEAEPLEFASLKSFGVYPWQVYLPPGDGL